jgi:hypothetical protein
LYTEKNLRKSRQANDKYLRFNPSDHDRELHGNLTNHLGTRTEEGKTYKAGSHSAAMCHQREDTETRWLHSTLWVMG